MFGTLPKLLQFIQKEGISVVCTEFLWQSNQVVLSNTDWCCHPYSCQHGWLHESLTLVTGWGKVIIWLKNIWFYHASELLLMTQWVHMDHYWCLHCHVWATKYQWISLKAHKLLSSLYFLLRWQGATQIWVAWAWEYLKWAKVVIN